MEKYNGSSSSEEEEEEQNYEEPEDEECEEPEEEEYEESQNEEAQDEEAEDEEAEDEEAQDEEAQDEEAEDEEAQDEDCDEEESECEEWEYEEADDEGVEYEEEYEEVEYEVEYKGSQYEQWQDVSSSSSHSSDEESEDVSRAERRERKRWKKHMKKGLIPPGTVPPWEQGTPGAVYGAPGGGYGAPGAYPAQPYPAGAPVAYPAAAAYGQPGGYPVPGQPFGYPAPGQPGGYPVPGQPGGYPAPGQPGGYPAPGQPGGYPAPGQPGGYPAPGQPGGYPVPGQPGGYPVPGQPGGYPAPGQPGGYPAPGQPGGYPAPGQGVAGIGQQLQQVQLDGCAELFRPTVRPAANFSAEKDCEALRHAMKGAGTDEHTIIDIIGKRSNYQRQEIAKLYKTMFGRDIIKDLGSDLSGHFRETVMALFRRPSYYDAWSLQNALKGAGTKESVLIEILCTRTNLQIRNIVACYKQYFKRDLEEDIASDSSGHFKKLLVSCSTGNRHELTPQQLWQIRTQGPAAVVDMNLAREDAAKLHAAGVKRLGTDESAFITVLALRNMYQLQATFEEYGKLSGKDLLKVIDKETSGSFKTGLKAVVRSAKNRPEYFADKLHDSMKGMGTNDSRLIRIIVSRSEIDLQDIKEIYFKKYKKTLEKAVASDTSGEYKRLLLAIIGQ